jgi:hypothetical protein
MFLNMDYPIATHYNYQITIIGPWFRITLNVQYGITSNVQYSICRCMSSEIQCVYAHDTSPYQIIVVPLINVLFAMSSMWLFIEQKFHV